MDSASIRDSLARAGLSAPEIPPKVRLCERALAALPTERSTAPVLWFVPGRIEILGKHTDYAGGRSLVCAAERGFCIASVARTDDLVGVTDAATAERVKVRLGGADESGHPGWATYVAAVARRVGRNFPSARRGAELALASDLPAAAGMSSSSALVVGLFLALAAANDVEHDPAYESAIRSGEDLAAYLATIENGLSFGALAGDQGVGTFGGSEDHTAILLSEAGRMRQYAFCPTRLENIVVLPSGLTFAVASSGVEARKTGSARDAYNRASLAARRALALWNQRSGQRCDSLAQACSQAPGAVGEMMRLLASADDPDFPAGELLDRLVQFVEESIEIVPAAADALDRGDLDAFGALVARSQALAETKLRNQVPETVALARSARELGACAASAFGAGFGGGVWALVRRTETRRFLERWRAAYRKTFPGPFARAVFFVTAAGPGALKVR